MDVLDARSSESREGRACGWQYDEGDHWLTVCNLGISVFPTDGAPRILVHVC